MNPFLFPATCEVCGSDGVGTISTAAASWERGSFVSHRDPRVCADVLARQERQRKKRERLTTWAVPG